MADLYVCPEHGETNPCGGCRAETTKPQSTTACPFCTDTDFDMPGLKHHLLRGYCEVFEATPSLDDAVAERLRNARLDVRDCEHINRQC